MLAQSLATSSTITKQCTKINVYTLLAMHYTCCVWVLRILYIDDCLLGIMLCNVQSYICTKINNSESQLLLLVNVAD